VQNIRLFIAIELDDASKEFVTRLQRDLARASSSANLTARQNLHMTLAFLGETDEARLPQVCASMDRIHAPAFRLSIARVGCFSRHGADLWWVGVDGGSALRAIRTELAHHLEESRVWFDPKPFTPHLTIAREVRLKEERQRPVLMSTTQCIETEVRSLSLMLSSRVAGKLTYTCLHQKKLL
jgi:2'-5' RNA ligase